MKKRNILIVALAICFSFIFVGGCFLNCDGNGANPILRITSSQNQHYFVAGNFFDPYGLVVEFSENAISATDENATWVQATNFGISPQTPLELGQNFVTITYRSVSINHPILVIAPGDIPPTPPTTTTPPNTIAVTSITVTAPATTTWYANNPPDAAGRQFTKTFLPDNATANTTWHSSNPSFASINQYGIAILASAVAAGSFQIFARSGSGANMVESNRITITVNAPLPGATPASIAIYPTTTRHWVYGVNHNPLANRRSFSLTTIPADASRAGIQWVSSNPAVATIDAFGYVTLVGTGHTYISASYSGTALTTTSTRVNVTQNGVVAQTGPDNSARGVGYSFGNADTRDATMAAMTNGCNPISWFYTWGNTPNANATTLSANNNVNFVPMHWGDNSMHPNNMTNIRNWVLARRAAGHEVSYIRALNEVNISGQGAILPGNFVYGTNSYRGWRAILQLARELDLKIVGPTVAHGNVTGTLAGPNGRYTGEYGGANWIVSFLRAIQSRNNPIRYGTIHDLAAIAVNTYSSWPSHFSIFAERPRATVRRELGIDIDIWVTEWAAWYYPYRKFNGTQAGSGPQYRTREMQRRWQAWHMSQTIAWMEQSNAVTKYAWYHMTRSTPAPSINLMNGSTPTEIGIIYANASVFDSNYWIDVTQGPISAAGRITRNNISTWANNPLFASAPATGNLNSRNGFRESVNFWPTTVPTANRVTAIDVRDLGRMTGTEAVDKWIEYQIYIPAGQGGNFRLDLLNRSLFTSNATVAITNITGRSFNQTFTANPGWRTTSINLGNLPAGRHTLRITGTTPLRGTGWAPLRSNHDDNLMLHSLEFVRI